jgi:PAS domain S-box-containing protein
MDKKATHEEFQQVVNRLEREACKGTSAQKTLEESVERLKVAYDQSIIYQKALHEEITERQRAEKALQKAHEELEARVDQRTQELVRANASLSGESERLKKAQEALKKAYNEIERRFGERTAELEAVNAQLRKEIEERQRAEEACRASEANYRAIFNAINDAILVHDVETGEVVDVNWRMFEMYGVSPAEVRQLTDNVDLSLGGPPYTAESASEWFKKAAKGEAQLFEWRAKDHSGRDFWVEVNLKRALISGQHRLLAVVRDITERKLAQEKLITYHDKLRAMASRLSLAEERERRRIATEVHDHIGQNLAFAKIKLGTLLRSITSDSLGQAVGQVVKLVDEAIRDTRALISELGSPILYELGFVPAVDWLTQQVEKRHGIALSCEDDGQSKPLSDDVCVLLFQGVRELLANVVRHAQAHNGKVCITRHENDIQIDVEDDGVGFDPASIGPGVGQNSRFGLFSLRERLEPLGGHIEVASKTGQGTKVTLRGPLKSDGKNKRRKVS